LHPARLVRSHLDKILFEFSYFAVKNVPGEYTNNEILRKKKDLVFGLALKDRKIKASELDSPCLTQQ